MRNLVSSACAALCGLAFATVVIAAQTPPAPVPAPAPPADKEIDLGSVEFGGAKLKIAATVKPKEACLKGTLNFKGKDADLASAEVCGKEVPAGYLATAHAEVARVDVGGEAGKALGKVGEKVTGKSSAATEANVEVLVVEGKVAAGKASLIIANTTPNPERAYWQYLDGKFKEVKKEEFDALKLDTLKPEDLKPKPAK